MFMYTNKKDFRKIIFESPENPYVINLFPLDIGRYSKGYQPYPSGTAGMYRRS
jgi:hypothetical protein